MNTRVKICGVTRAEDALAAAELGAWAVGMIFAPASPRRLSIEEARRVCAALPRSVLRVGVFQDQPQEEIEAADQALGFDMLQFHGAETDLFCRVFGIGRAIKAVTVSSHADVQQAASREAAILLLDKPKDLPTADKTVDWELAAALARRKERMLLAGGLDALNVGDAVRKVRPWGIDASSGVESRPGVKDKAKLRDFFAAVLQAEEAA